MAGKPKPIPLSAAVRGELESWLRSTTIRQGLAQRARIILLSAAGETAAAIADKVGVSTRVVFKWRRRFHERGLSGLYDAPRPGQPRKLSAATVKQVLQLTTERVPQEATHWSTRLMARYAGVTRWQVRQIWAAADLKPHRLETFKLSNDPQFAEKVVDVVGLYLNPPDNALVLGVDEKTQIQALERTQGERPLAPGRPQARTHDYTRHGVTNLYAAFNLLTGEVIGRTTQRHRAREFLAFLRQIERSTPPELDLHLVLDNSSTHTTPAVKAWLEQHPRFHLHFTPTSASWLNAVESWFGQLERRMLYRGVFTSVGELRQALHRYIRLHNEHHAKPFRWTKKADVILDAVERAHQYQES